MKNILFLSHLFPSKSRPYYGLFVLDQIKALSEMGLNITVVCVVPWAPMGIPLLNRRWETTRNLPGFEVYEGIPVYYPRGITIPGKLVIIRGRMFYFSLKKFFINLIIKYKFDLIHAQSVFPDADLGMYLKKLFDIPLVVTIHGHDLQVLAKNSDLLRKRLLRILSGSNGIGLVSQKLRGLLMSYDKNKVIKVPKLVISNGIRMNERYRNENQKKESNDIVFITIASLIQQKGFFTVLEALKILSGEFPNIRYTIIGDGWDKSLIVEKINELQLHDRVKLLGTLTHKQAMEVLNDSDIFVLPSVNESFGIVYIEAMYLKKIVIGSEGEGINEVIKNGENGFLIEPNNVKKLSELFKYIILNLDKLGNLREAAYKTVWQRYTWDNNARQYLKLYDKVLKDFII